MAETESNDRRREQYASLARVFADLAGRGTTWRNQLEDWNMKRSESVMEWQAEAEAKARAEDVLKVLHLRFGAEMPLEIVQSIRNNHDLGKLDRWLEAAVKARSLNKFRQAMEM